MCFLHVHFGLVASASSCTRLVSVFKTTTSGHPSATSRSIITSAFKFWSWKLFVLAQLVTPASAQGSNRPVGRAGGPTEAQCDLSGIATSSAYLQHLRIAAIFIVLAASIIGVIIPLLPQIIITCCSRRLRHRSSLSSSESSAEEKSTPSSSTSSTTSKIFRILKSHRTWDETFFVLRHFGTGVVTATAFVHLSYESMVELESPCIHLVYKPLAGVLQMVALAIVFFIDCLTSRYLDRLRKRNTERKETALSKFHQQYARNIHRRYRDENAIAGNADDAGDTSLAHSQRALSDDLEKEHAAVKAEDRRLDEKTKELELIIIEGGIVFHSMMVGIGTGTSSDDGFVPYLIAITFHQFFDGIGEPAF
ncbi:hypothetical protein P389DRAFT_20454 [Cystobasidium minutum MCA 4210]|uniref:uncharacterized protein n=1 Tax=Cystobasidium minutum MCA 4210 TaxID=1397322 RepID=UPI0034CF4912|eukprot:jgi/Rhomi1/20454/CE20453_1568